MRQIRQNWAAIVAILIPLIAATLSLKTHRASLWASGITNSITPTQPQGSSVPGSPATAIQPGQGGHQHPQDPANEDDSTPPADPN